MFSKIEWYRTAARNLGLPSLLRRQLQKRFGPQPNKLTSRYLMHPVFARVGTSDLKVFDQIFVEREYRCLDQIQNAAFILDCGANVGYSSAYFLSRFPESFVLAVEPDGVNFSLLKSNLLPYGDRFRAIRAAVWPRADRLSFKRSTVGLGLEWGRQVELAPHGHETVEAISIPMLMATTEFRRIAILKIDIEGSELELFTSQSLAWLDLVDHIVIELHSKECAAAFFAAIDPARYDISTCGELTVCLGKS